MVVAALSAVAVGTTSCVFPGAHQAGAAVRLFARTRRPALPTSVLAGAPDVLAAGMAKELFLSAPVVVIASTNPADVAKAAARAGRLKAPLLLTSARAGSGAGSAAMRAEVDALHPRAVLAIGVPASVLSAQLPGVQVDTDPAQLPATSAPAPQRHRVVVLVQQGGPTATAAMAAAATARAVGAHVIVVPGYDPRADPGAIVALSAARPERVLAVGAGFGPVGRLASRLAVAETGVQLPGGGQVVFPMRRLVALYGNPGTPSLGALGEQDLSASIERARKNAAMYKKLSSVPVVPTFEIIATVAQASPGPDGSYSYETPVSVLRPWVRAATAARMYVILDLQPGRANLLTQAKVYEPLLKLPNVGLALDPEWKLQPGQVPLQQIGSVGIGEVNSVINWLARLTAQYRLPQKVLVLHQFRLSMIRDEQRLNTRHDDIAIVIHMDGQGTPQEKQETWDVITEAAPAGVFFGFKNFYTKDHPMLTPWQTMHRTPQPVMISYQ
jgi:hypothetical protein